MRYVLDQMEAESVEDLRSGNADAHTVHRIRTIEEVRETIRTLADNLGLGDPLV